MDPQAARDIEGGGGGPACELVPGALLRDDGAGALAAEVAPDPAVHAAAAGAVAATAGGVPVLLRLWRRFGRDRAHGAVAWHRTRLTRAEGCGVCG
eukprot:COSAG05_NODE_4377_length_1543_cov_3.068560_1_plen_95_part_01